MGQEQVHYASNIVSNSHLFHSKSIDLPTHKIWLLKFDLENPRSRSWVRSKFKVITWVQHPIDSRPFGSISTHPLIPIIELFQNLTFKIQGRSQSSMSHIMYNNPSTPHIPVIPPVDRPPFLRCNCLKKMTLKIQGQGHGRGQESNALLTHIPLVPCPIPELQYFPNLTKKIQGQGHSSRSQSRYNTLSTPPIPGIHLFQNLTSKTQGQGHGWGQSWK